MKHGGKILPFWLTKYFVADFNFIFIFSHICNQFTPLVIIELPQFIARMTYWKGISSNDDIQNPQW